MKKINLIMFVAVLITATSCEKDISQLKAQSISQQRDLPKKYQVDSLEIAALFNKVAKLEKENNLIKQKISNLEIFKNNIDSFMCEVDYY